jgi:hypothetical protein
MLNRHFEVKFPHDNINNDKKIPNLTKYYPLKDKQSRNKPHEPSARVLILEEDVKPLFYIIL